MRRGTETIPERKTRLPEQRSTTLDQAALQRLLNISAEILGQLDLDRLLASIMTGAADLLDASQINLYRYVVEGDLLETWIHLRAPESINRLELRRGEGLAGRVLASGRGLRIDDYDRWEGRSPQWPEGVTGPSMAVPLRRLDELLGVITVARPPGTSLFADSDLTLLQLFANQAAVAIANAQLYAGVTRRAEELSKLYDTSLDMVGQLDLARRAGGDTGTRHRPPGMRRQPAPVRRREEPADPAAAPQAAGEHRLRFAETGRGPLGPGLHHRGAAGRQRLRCLGGPLELSMLRVPSPAAWRRRCVRRAMSSGCWPSTGPPIARHSPTTIYGC